LQDSPRRAQLLAGVSVGLKAFEILIALFFTFATAAYWIFERDRTIDFVASLLPRPRRKKMRDTWKLIDLKLGAFVRGDSSCRGSSAMRPGSRRCSCSSRSRPSPPKDGETG
jgi:hypothetical protein